MNLAEIFKGYKNWKNNFFNKESFSRKFAITFSGNIVNLILQLALSPILSRIYKPEVYGIYAIFNAISMNFALISSLSYTNAILKATNEQDAIRLARISIVLSAIFSFLSIFLMLIFQPDISTYFGLNKLGWLIFLIPLVAFMYNTNISLSALNIYNHKISKDVTVITSTNIFNRVFNVGYGIITNGATLGLVLGDVFGKTIRFFWLMYIQIKSIKIRITLNELITTFKDYKKFPLFILPSSLIGLISNQMPIFLFSFYFGSTTVGYFSFASSMLFIPIQLFANSSSSIFLKKATDTYTHKGLVGLQSVTNKIFWSLLLVGVVSYGILIPFGELAFNIVFGKEWSMAGIIFSYLAFSYILMIASQPLNNIFLVLHKERFVFLQNVFGIIVKSVSLIPGIYYNDFLLSLKLFSITNFVYYLILSLIAFKLLKFNLFAFLIKITFLLGLILAYTFLIKSFL